MPPRIYVRRVFLGVLFCGGVLLFSLALLELGGRRAPWSPLNNIVSRGTGVPQRSRRNEEIVKRTTPKETSHTERPASTGSPLAYTEADGTTRKLWFLDGGNVFPKPAVRPPVLFPIDSSDDRVVEQLMYVPDYYEGMNTPEKVILVYSGVRQFNKEPGPGTFEECPVNRCTLTEDQHRASDADAVIYKDHFAPIWAARPTHQVWILYYLECPYHTQNVKTRDAINWTATYRTDSDVVTPYERWTYYDSNIRQMPQNRDYAANKTKKVAWFVSNCGARNGRLEYARELSKHIQVDIYGSCGPLKCPRTDKNKCFELLDKDYKFYLAFENSNCRDYITEKFYVNGLGRNILPIVMGARPEDYERSAPQGSYIHVDEFANPKELAAYLHRLDKDNDLYNSYFHWKGTGEFINTYFWCRLCAMLHAPHINKHYENVDDWWRGPGVCTTKSWRNSY